MREAAVDAGAGAIGFIFWPESPRFIDPHRARAIVADAAAVRHAGRRVREPAGGVRQRRRERWCGSASVQLHGDETPAFAAARRRGRS